MQVGDYVEGLTRIEGLPTPIVVNSCKIISPSKFGLSLQHSWDSSLFIAIMALSHFCVKGSMNFGQKSLVFVLPRII